MQATQGENMPALVPELVDMASTPAVSTADLLRRALVVARRLAVPELVDWINSELNGYSGEVPDYRRLCGQLKVMNPINGPIPLMMPSAAATERYNRADIRQGVPELVELAKSTTGIYANFTPRIEHELMATHFPGAEPASPAATGQRGNRRRAPCRFINSRWAGNPRRTSSGCMGIVRGRFVLTDLVTSGSGALPASSVSFNHQMPSDCPKSC